MDFKTLKAFLATRAVAVVRNPDGTFDARRPDGMADREWTGILKWVEPDLIAQAWAINTHLLDPWPVDRIVAYLDEHAIRIDVRKGQPYLVFPRAMVANGGPWPGYHAAVLLPHLKARKRDVLAHYEPVEEWGIADLLRRNTVYPAGTQAGDREAILSTFLYLSRGFGGLLAWFSPYTRRTGYAERLTDGVRVPIDAAQVAVTTPAGEPLSVWHKLPGHRGPDGWKWPSGKELPPGCNAPPGWVAETPATLKKKRSDWYKQNWTVPRSESNLPD